MTQISDPVFPFGMMVHEVDFLRWVSSGCDERKAIDIYRNSYFTMTYQRMELRGFIDRQIAWKEIAGGKIVFCAPFVLTRLGQRVLRILNFEKR
jgi:hypothetical protein